jgi:flavin reductase (DIM6/NTAB) family NADH-FMN oxidoreductase RutF
MSSRGFGPLMSALDPPLIVVTTAEAGEPAGCLVQFHTQSSIQPPRYCVWLSKANHTYRVALRSSYLAVHFLAADDLRLAELFGTKSGDTVDKFAGLETEPGPDGVPLLMPCANRMVTRRLTLLDEGGDHVSFITEPADVHRAGRFTPLRLSRAGHLVAGHGYWERPDPPTERAAGR